MKIALLVLGWILVALPAQAATPKERARKQYLAAEKLRAEGRFAEALAAYRALAPLAERLGRGPFVCWGIARSQEGLKRFDAQLETLRRCIKAPGRDTENLRRARVMMEIKIKTLEARRLGWIEVTCAERGFTLRLDDARPVACPRKWVGLPPGRHRLRVYRGERVWSRRELTVEAGHPTRVTVPAPARLDVVNLPPGARVTVDDAAVAAPFPLLLAPGEHEVAVSAPGRGPARRAVAIEPGQQATLVAELRAPSRSTRTRWLIGAAALGLGAGITFGVAHQQDGAADDAYARYQALDDPSAARLDAARSDTEAYEARAQTLQWVSLGLLSGALISGAIGLWWSGEGDGSRLRPMVGRERVGAQISW